MKTLCFTVYGNVQGVGFRWFTQDAASRYGITGWVANRPDGAVTGTAHGPAAAVDAFLADLAAGPPAGRVASLEVRDDPDRTQRHQRFEIRTP